MENVKPLFAPGDVVYRVYEPESLKVQKFLVTGVRYTDVRIDDEGIKTSNRFVYNGLVNLSELNSVDGFLWMEKNDVIELELYPTKEDALVDLGKLAAKISKEIKKLDLE